MRVRYEWDEDKAASNLLKHGISFPEATAVFDDPDLIEKKDERDYDGEVRLLAVGSVNGLER